MDKIEPCKWHCTGFLVPSNLYTWRCETHNDNRGVSRDIHEPPSHCQKYYELVHVERIKKMKWR